MTLDSDLILMAGPCSVESEEQIMKIAEAVAETGTQYLRGGAYKPRTKGGDWEGHGIEALKWMRQAADKYGMKVVTEILGPDSLERSLGEMIKIYQDNGVDLFQVGARNAQNQDLLNGLGEAGVPVLLKNGMNTTISEWLGSATRVNQDGLMLCPRGKNNDTDAGRNAMDMNLLGHVIDNTKYTVIFDPSHISGKRENIFSITQGAVAMGADGLIVEVHHDPIMSKTDSRQALTPKMYQTLVEGATISRKAYVEQQKIREQYSRLKTPSYIDIYVDLSAGESVKNLLKDIKFSEYERPGEKVFTARISSGNLDKLQRSSISTGKIVKYKPEVGDASAEGIHFTVAGHDDMRVKFSPFGREALKYRGREGDKSFKGPTIEFVHGYAGQPVHDGFLTIRMMRSNKYDIIPSLESTQERAVASDLIKGPVVLYRPVVEK